MTATERFKMLLANALERVCVLEEQLEVARARIAALDAAAVEQAPSRNNSGAHKHETAAHG